MSFNTKVFEQDLFLLTKVQSSALHSVSSQLSASKGDNSWEGKAHQGSFKKYVENILTFCLTTYPPALTFSMVWTLTKSGHFWTTYPPPLVNVVFERPLISFLHIQSVTHAHPGALVVKGSWAFLTVQAVSPSGWRATNFDIFDNFDIFVNPSGIVLYLFPSHTVGHACSPMCNGGQRLLGIKMQ